MRDSTRQRLQKAARELRVIVLILAGVLAARSTLADHYYVPSGSMEATLVSGDRVFVDKLAHGLRVPFTHWQVTDGEAVARGEIVIFDSPRDGKRLIKRIVAIGGDSVAVDDGRLTINGRPMALPDDRSIEQFGQRRAVLNLEHGGGPDYRQQVPAGKLLAVGDHRGNSIDGRIFGLIDEDEVYGKAIAIYYRRGEGFTWKSL